MIGVLVKIKICGITNKEDALKCEKLGADALGFIFYKRSERFIKPEDAAIIVSLLSPFTFKIGVFVNDIAENVNSVAQRLKLNAVQLHGDEDVEFIKRIDYPAIKAFRVDESFDFMIINEYSSVSILLDSYNIKLFGGTGNKFNWNKIPESLRSKIILAGGINSSNVEYIINKIKPAAIDISSSVESSPGKKDIIKLKEIFNKINICRSSQC